MNFLPRAGKLEHCQCYAVLVDEERREAFGGIFSENRIPVMGNMLHNSKMPFFVIDRTRCTKEELEKLNLVIAKKFGSKFKPKEDIPIKADGALLIPCEKHE